jgi:hypothetical protein
MLSKDIQVVDLGSDNWSRLMRLPAEVVAAAGNGARPRSLLVVYRGLRVLKAVDLSSGRGVEVEWLGTSRLELLSRQSGFGRVVALEESALSRVFEHAQRELDYTDDMLEQWLGFARGVSREWRRTIFTYPAGPSRILVPPYRLIEGVLRSLIPDNTLLLFAVTERGRVWTSAVLGFREGDFWLLSSLDSVGMEESDLRDGGLASACEMLSAKFSGKVRALVVERSDLARIAASRFPAADLLWSLNTGDLKRVDVPRRWRMLIFAGALTATLKK